MQATPLTYPECVPPKWGLHTAFSIKDMRGFLYKGLSGMPNAPRTLAYKATLEAVNTLHARGITEFRGDKVLKLLIQAAREHGWLKRDGGRYVAVPKASQVDHKVCRKCKQEKHIDEFRMEATPAQKAARGWAEDRRHYTYAVSCAHCRKLKKQTERRKEVKRASKTGFALLRDTLQRELAGTMRALRKHVAFTTPEGGKVYQFECDEDQRYYFERERLLRLALQRFDAGVDEGDLNQRIDSTEPAGAWQSLLTEQERERLADLHRQGSWSGSAKKGGTPKLWEPRRPQTRTHQPPPPYEPSPEPVAPPPEILFASLPTDTTPWSEM